MSKVLVATRNLPKKEWLEWRKKGIGGSDVSAVCGLNRYKSPVELWLEKTGQIEPKEAGEAAYWGNLLEPLIRVEFTERTGLQIRRNHSILKNPKYPFMLANLDGIALDPVKGKCVFEAKTANAFKSGDWVEHIPEEYQLQVQHYLAVTGFNGAYVAVLIGGNQFKWYYLEKDNDLITMLIQLEKRFWNYVETNTSPPLDGTEASTDLLNRLYSNSNQSKIQLPEAALPLISQYEQAYEQERIAQEQKNEAINRLKAYMGENESGIIGDRIVTWKSVSSERLNSKLLKEELPEVHAKYVSTSSYRRFSIK